MSYTDVVSRIDQIQSQLSAMQAAFTPAAATTATTTTTPVPSSTGATTPTYGTFSAALAQAQGAIGASPAGGPVDASQTTTGTGTGALPAKAQTMLTSDQQQFASRLAADTGLDPGVITAWLLAEESGGAAQSRQAANNNDWLNIGYTDSATYGSSDAIWSDPTAAADATAGWLKGQNTIPGYGTASSGIQAILQTAGQSPSAQIAAIQGSGWASGGYPDLPGLYQQVSA
jgi:hypothetical protein